MLKHCKLFAILLLATILILTAFTSNAAANDGGQGESAAVLTAFGIIDTATDLSTEITRAGAAQITAKLLAISSNEKNSGFEDVPTDASYASAVCSLRSLGIINGIDDSHFAPDETISAEQSAKMLVTVLGYKEYAESYGGYPGGYLSVASMLGILKKVTVGDYDACTTEEFAQMSFNCLEIPLMIKSVSAVSPSYEKSENKTVLSEYLKAGKTEGIVDGNSITTLNKIDGLQKGYISIDGTIYRNSTLSADSLFGYKVTAYYSIDEDAENPLIYIAANENVTVNKILSEDIISSSSNDKVTYYKNDKQDTLPFDSNVKFVYNGKLLSRAVTQSDLSPQCGSLTLLDNNNDDKADFVFIENELIYVVDSANKSTYTIADKYSLPLFSPEMENPDIEVSIVKAGENVPFSKIKRNTVLSVIKSEDNSFIKMVISSAKATGTVTEIADGGKSICIDGKEYKTIAQNRSEILKTRVGDKATFYLTADGIIAGCSDGMQETEQYAYFIKGSENKQGIDSEKSVNMRLYMLADGTFRDYKTSEKIMLNDEVQDVPSPSKHILSMLSQNPGGELIKFTTDSDGNINNIKRAVASNATHAYDCYNPDEFSLDYDASLYKRLIYVGGDGLLGNFFTIRNSLLAVVPKLQPGETELDEDSIGSSYEFKISELYGNFELYDVDENNNAAVILIRENATTGTELDSFFVDKYASAVDRDGNAATKIYGYYKNQYVGFVVAPDAQIQTNDADVYYTTGYSDRETQVVAPKRDLQKSDYDFERGDIIRITLSANNEITTIRKIFKFDRDKSTVGGYQLNGKEYNDRFSYDTDKVFVSGDRDKYSTTGWYAEDRIVHCRALSINGSVLSTICEDKTGAKNFYPMNAVLSTDTEYYVYDEKSGNVYQGKQRDIDPNDDRQTIVMRVRYQGAYEILIINREQAADMDCKTDYSYPIYR